MTWLEFFSTVIQSLVLLAWPVAIVYCVLLFRERLGQLLPLIRVRHKDWEASFRLDQAEKEAEQLPPVAPTLPSPTPEELSRFEQVAKLSPRAAILELRATLEAAMRALAQETGLARSERVSPSILIRHLRSKELINPHISAMLDDLRVYGNVVAHSRDVEHTVDDALRYRELANRALSALEIARLVG